MGKHYCLCFAKYVLLFLLILFYMQSEMLTQTSQHAKRTLKKYKNAKYILKK